MDGRSDLIVAQMRAGMSGSQYAARSAVSALGRTEAKELSEAVEMVQKMIGSVPDLDLESLNRDLVRYTTAPERRKRFLWIIAYGDSKELARPFLVERIRSAQDQIAAVRLAVRKLAVAGEDLMDAVSSNDSVSAAAHIAAGDVPGHAQALSQVEEDARSRAQVGSAAARVLRETLRARLDAVALAEGLIMKAQRELAS